ncbi:MAG: hypothetical protein P1U42_06770 [Phycisphaerales bacterium]|nr:hypothetical protein [Phycisphaerales bacterium]
MGTANSASSSQTPASNTAEVMGSSQLRSDQASIVEPRPIVETVGSEDMFLSPRVIDAGAFTRYSEMLKSIITQASTQGRALEDFSADAEAMIKRCETSSETINKRMQAGVRMLKMIDERANRTDILLDKIQTTLPDSDSLASQIDEIIERRLSESQNRIDQIVADAEARVLAAEQRASEATKFNDEHISAINKIAESIESRLSEIEARVDEARNESSKSIIELDEQSSQTREQIRTTLDLVVAKSQEAGANLAFKIDEASNLTDARIAELNRSIEPVLDSAQQAMRTLGIDPENPVFEDSPLARIENLVERGEAQTASLDRVYRQLEDLQTQAEGVKAVFGMWLVDAAGELDVLEARKDTLVGPMSEAADKIAKLGPDLENKLELASTQLTHLQVEQQTLRQTIQASSSIANDVTENMTNQSGQLQALLDGSLHKLSTRVEQAGVWLGALIQRAEELGATLPGAGRMEFGNQPIPANPTPAPVARVAPVATPEQVVAQPVSQEPIVANPTVLEEPTRKSVSLSLDPIASEPPAPSMIPAQISKPALSTASAIHIQSEPAHFDSIDTDQTQTNRTPSNTELHITDSVENRVVSPQPPQLPIDAFSFDGAATVIEHRNDLS